MADGERIVLGVLKNYENINNNINKKDECIYGLDSVEIKELKFSMWYVIILCVILSIKLPFSFPVLFISFYENQKNPTKVFKDT